MKLNPYIDFLILQDRQVSIFLSITFTSPVSFTLGVDNMNCWKCWQANCQLDGHRVPVINACIKHSMIKCAKKICKNFKSFLESMTKSHKTSVHL